MMYNPSSLGDRIFPKIIVEKAIITVDDIKPKDNLKLPVADFFPIFSALSNL